MPGMERIKDRACGNGTTEIIPRRNQTMNEKNSLKLGFLLNLFEDNGYTIEKYLDMETAYWFTLFEITIKTLNEDKIQKTIGEVISILENTYSYRVIKLEHTSEFTYILTLSHKKRFRLLIGPSI
jgi:hypothetical protein